MNKKIFFYLLATLLFTHSCEQNDIADVGTISFNVLKDDNNLVVDITKGYTADKFAVEILNSKGELILSNQDYTTITDPIQLDVGKYEVKMYTPNMPSAVFDTPYYYGSTTFTSIINVNKVIDVSCSHAMAKVAISFSDNFKKYIASCNTTISNGMMDGSLVFIDEDIRIGYFKTDLAKLTYRLDAITVQGAKFTVSRTLDIKKADFLKINIDVDLNEKPSNPNAIFNIIVNETLNDKLTTIPLNNNPNNTTIPPTFTTSEGGADIMQPIVIFSPNTKDVGINITAASEITYLGLKFNGNDLCDEYGLPNSLNLLDYTQAVRSGDAIANAGITYTLSSDRLSAHIDFTEMTSKLSYSTEGATNHDIEVMTIDDADRFTAHNLNFTTFSKRHKALDATLTPSQVEGNNLITFRLTSTEVLAGLSFIYKLKDGSDWTIVTPTEVEGNIYSHTIDLAYGDYILSSAIAIDGVISEEGDVVINIPSSEIKYIPNLNFDQWYKDNKNWYPNESGGNSYWATGNEGATIGGENITVPSDDVAVEKEGGMAVRMFSKKVIGKFAAGNLFTGTFKLNISNPIESVGFGREYTGRPTHLSGYYKYKNGGSDGCQIYIKLENRTLNKVVAYGELSDSNNSTEYIPFTFKIKYNEGADNTPVTHVTIVATSSIRGADFIGDVGSELFVDEFELLYIYKK